MRPTTVVFILGAASLVVVAATPPTEDRMQVLTNQLGYDPADRKVAIIQRETPADEKRSSVAGRFRVLDKDGEVVMSGELTPAGNISLWGKSYWQADFTELRKAGTYTMIATLGASRAKSFPFTIGSNIVPRQTLTLAGRFFFYQRCGFAVPGWHAPCHLDDAKVPEGGHIDAVGGWHDAGDYNKYNGYTPLSVYALAATAPPRERPSRFPGQIEEARWGADWLLKMIDPKTDLLHRRVFSGYGFWGPPEKETDNIPGTEDDRPLSAASGAGEENARASLALATLAERLPARSRAKYLDAAQRLWAAAGRRSLGPKDHASLALAALSFSRITKQSTWREDAEKTIDPILAAQQPDGSFGVSGICDQGYVPACLAMLARAMPEGKRADRIRDALKRYVAFATRRSQNPLRIMQWDDATFFYPHADEKAWYVGQNSMYLSQAWALLLIGRLNGDAEARDVALAQIDWVLGRNPFGVCMFEGRGSFNPPRYHHRYDGIPGHARGAVPGTVCNGIVRESPASDRPKFDLKGKAYQSNEPWLPHNAYYLLAASQLPERD